MSQVTPEEAVDRLRERGGYDWLLNGPEAWSASKIANELTKMGLSVSKETVISWFKQLPHTQDFGKVGLSASRRDLLVFFASRMVRRV